MYKASEANKLSIQNNKELNKSAINEIMEIIDEYINDAVKEGSFETAIGFGAHCKRFRIDDVHSFFKTISKILNEYGYECSLRYSDSRMSESILSIFAS